MSLPYSVVLFLSSVASNVSTDTKAVSQNETSLLIGSGPLPARAPPEKKPVTTTSSQAPKVASQPAPVSSASAGVVSETPPAKAVAPAPVPAPVPPPPVMSSTSLPKLTQPMPLASRPPLANIARGVAAAFLEQDDDDETADVKTSTGVSTSAAIPGTSVPQSFATAKKLETNRLAAAKPPAPVPPPDISTVIKSAATKGDFMIGLSGMSYSDMVLAAQTQKTVSGLPFDRGDGKGLGLDHQKSRTSESSRHSAAKTSYQSKRRGPSTDSRGRKKLEIGRNVM